MSGRSALARAAVPVLLVLLVAACGGGQRQVAEPKADARPAGEPTVAPATVGSGASPSASPSPSPTRSVPPAASAGGLCKRLSYDRVAAALGVRFDVAAASGAAGSEQVCVLQRVGATAPDLTWSRLPVPAAEEPEEAESPGAGTPTPMTPVEVFRADYQPASAKNVGQLGKAAYSRVVAAGAGAGPQIEVGWLGAEVVYVLTFTTSQGTSPAQAAQQIPRVVGLASQLAR